MDKVKSFIEKLNIKQRIGIAVAALLLVILAFIWLYNIYGNDSPKNENKKQTEKHQLLNFYGSGATARGDFDLPS